jgi:hypothetical protein
MMEVAVSSMDTAKSSGSFLILAGVFEKIALTEKKNGYLIITPHSVMLLRGHLQVMV